MAGTPPPAAQPPASRRRPEPLGVRAARQWRTGLLVALGVFGLVAGASSFLGERYSSRALMEIAPAAESGEAAADDGPKIEEKLSSLLDHAPWLATLVKEAGVDESPEAAEAVRGAIVVTTRSPHTFDIAFHADSPKLAHDGCAKLANAIAERFGREGDGAPSASPKEREALATLRQKTKELADFVVLHPGIVQSGGAAAAPSAAPTKARPAPPDATIELLRQERSRVAVDLAKAEADANSPVAHDNPYDDDARADLESLRKRMAEIRAAILARQSALSREHGPPSVAPAAAPAASATTGLVDDWKRLVQAVSDAQRAAPKAASAGTLVARIVESATTPTRPVTLNRALGGLVGGFLGLVLGLVAAFLRASRTAPRARAATPAPTGAATPAAAPRPVDPRAFATTVAIAAPPAGTPPAPAEKRAAGLPANVPQPAANPGAPAGPSPPPPAGQRSPLPDGARGVGVHAIAEVNIPRPPAVPNFSRNTTQVGMVDPERLARDANRQSDGAAMKPAPMVQVKGEAGPRRPPMPSPPPLSPPPPRPSSPPRAPDAPSQPWPAGGAQAAPAGAQARPSRPPAAPLSPPPPPPPSRRPFPAEESSPITARLGSGDVAPEQERGAAIDRAVAIRRSDTSYSYVDRLWRPRKDEPVNTERGHTEVVDGTFVDEPARERMPSASGTRPSDRPPRERMPSVSGSRQSDRPPRERMPSVSGSRPSDRPPRERMPSVSGSRQSDRPPRPVEFNATRPGWEIPAAAYEVPNTETALARVPPQTPRDDDLIDPHSAPPSWRMGASLVDGAGNEIAALRDQLLQHRRAEGFVVGISGEGDAVSGKSQVAARLAALLASDGGARVLLMETNFDYPAVHELLDIEIPHSSGFSQQMRARIRSGERRPWSVVKCSPTLHVLAEGVLRSPGILLSQEFAIAVAELRRSYDFIVADGPVVGTGADHKALDAVIDGIVVAVRPGGALDEALDRASQWFKRKDFVAAVPTRAA